MIERNPQLVDQGKLDGPLGGGRALLGQLRQTGVALDAEDVYLVERLAESVVWTGRYPIPKRAESMALRRTPLGELAAPGDFHPDKDSERIDELWERLKSNLWREWEQKRPELVLAFRVIETGDLSLLLQGGGSSADTHAE